ncbi:uncharacterized protein LOC124366424 isoform X2 [Homalodisca vitripennis]|uniref:uncharacterized protein LOC124366424 isoform X2 n=1 Tax=Homalodisca vitripennis TaxID=197043 RepID=UPI001EECD48D|nr:uncharacterized protein LOC124366424 isoform X2 [Homalodisca vitripennis]
MKPSVLIESNTGTANGKKMKQMTLSLSRTEKKHDISLSERFKGGVAGGSKLSDDEKDMVLPSPDRLSRTSFVWNAKSLETMEDPDMTVFNPAITSTCLHVENSYDRLPQVPKSPKYKYRRDTVRKRDERKKLPGQDCDQCAKYYEAAGLDNTQEIRSRMNACSRHRDKYQIRMNTPPGFWDPVLPASP